MTRGKIRHSKEVVMIAVTRVRHDEHPLGRGAATHESRPAGDYLMFGIIDIIAVSIEQQLAGALVRHDSTSLVGVYPTVIEGSGRITEKIHPDDFTEIPIVRLVLSRGRKQDQTKKQSKQ